MEIQRASSATSYRPASWSFINPSASNASRPKSSEGTAGSTPYGRKEGFATNVLDLILLKFSLRAYIWHFARQKHCAAKPWQTLSIFYTRP